jgi:hypothetical protein
MLNLNQKPIKSTFLTSLAITAFTLGLSACGGGGGTISYLYLIGISKTLNITYNIASTIGINNYYASVVCLDNYNLLLDNLFPYFDQYLD